MSTLYIIRGLPGSGKSTLARNLTKDLGCAFYEADQWFERMDGSYEFDPRELNRAHRWCFNSAMRDMNAGLDVVVSNTFTTLREMRDYIEAAIALEMEVRVIHCTGNYGSVHNVPAESIDRMKARWFANEQLTMHYAVKVQVI